MTWLEWLDGVRMRWWRRRTKNAWVWYDGKQSRGNEKNRWIFSCNDSEIKARNIVSHSSFNIWCNCWHCYDHRHDSKHCNVNIYVIVWYIPYIHIYGSMGDMQNWFIHMAHTTSIYFSFHFIFISYHVCIICYHYRIYIIICIYYIWYAYHYNHYHIYDSNRHFHSYVHGISSHIAAISELACLTIDNQLPTCVRSYDNHLFFTSLLCRIHSSLYHIS